jgi:hypothetical protein
MSCWGWTAVAVVAVVVLIFVVYKKDKARKERIERDGQTVLCWIVVANDALYQPRTGFRDYSYAQVVFTFEPETPELTRLLNDCAEQLQTYQPGEAPTEDERIIGSVMRNHVPHFQPRLVPTHLTRGKTIYTASVIVPWSKLPEGRLTRPYIIGRAFVGPDGGVHMKDYPNTESDYDPE